MPAEDAALSIGLYTSESIPDFRMNTFVALVKELSGSILGTDVEYLKHVIVLPEAAIDDFVNTLVHTIDEHAIPYQSPAGVIGAKALPLEVKGELWCYIILPESELAYVLPEGSEAQIVSSLIEELLHVRLYAAYFKQGVRRSDIWWEDHLSTLCRQFHDEYIVGRTKVPILAGLFPAPNLDQNDSFAVFYPLQLAPLLRQGVTQLTELMDKFGSGGVALNAFWQQLTQILYRSFFEPLARDAAYRDGNSTESPIVHDANEVPFYIEVIRPVWDAIYNELDRSFQSNCGELEACIARIVGHLVRFLASIGVTFRPKEGGEWWLFVDPSVFQMIIRTL